MASSQKQKKRIEIIDRELARGNKVKTKELLRIIKSETENLTSLKTIQNDLKVLETYYSAPVKYDTSKKAYYYADPNFTIKAFGLKEEDINILLLHSKILEHYKGHEIYEKVLKAVEKVIDSHKIRKDFRELILNRSLIQIEKVPAIKGTVYTPQIVLALQKSLKIEIDYKKFNGELSTRKVIPLLLKEDKHLWYLIGRSDGREDTVTFALDRIEKLKILTEKFDYLEFNPEEYFKNSFGVTVNHVEAIEVIISFTPQQGNYIKTLPIHSTQKEIKSTKKEYRISVTVKPSYEFYSKILSYGSDAKIISPRSIVTVLQTKLEDALKKY